MNKRQLIEATAQRTILTRREVHIALDTLVEIIVETLAQDEDVILRDFGRFQTRTYSERELPFFGQPGRHFVHSRQIPTFKPSAALRRRLQEKQPEPNRAP